MYICILTYIGNVICVDRHSANKKNATDDDDDDLFFFQQNPTIISRDVIQFILI